MDLNLILISLVILIFSAILHEVAHGIVAEKLGDPTARLLGRITLNPIPHIDPMMSIILPLLLIVGGSPFIVGGAKPVPVDPFNLREGRKDMALVALAGPLTNFLIAAIFALFLKFGIDFINNPMLLEIIFRIIQLNLLLGIFNLIPIPPLDGSKVFALLLPERQATNYLSMGNIGFILIFGLVYLFGGFLSLLLSFFLRLFGL